MAIDPNTQRPRPPKLSDFAPPQLQGTIAPPLPKKRTAGEIAGDTLRGIGQGASSLATGLAQVPNLLTGGALDDKIVRPAQSALSQALGGPAVSQGLAGASEEISGSIAAGYSPVLKAEQQKLQDADGWFEKAKTVATNPTLLGQFGAEQVPMLATLGAGAAGSASARSAQALAQGATQAAAQQVGKKAAERALIGANTAMGAGFAGTGAQQDAMSQPQEVWDANPEYQALVRGGTSPDEAKQQLALKAGQIAGAVAAPISGLAGAITAPLEASIFTRTLGGGVPALFSREGAGIVGRGIAKEAAEEAIQEGGEQFGQNVGIQQAVDPTRALSQDVADNAAIGGVLGGVLGGGLTAGGLALSREPLRDAPPAAGGQPAPQQRQTQPPAPRAPSPAEQEQQLRQAVAMAQTPEQATAAAQALAGFLEQQGRLLEPPQTIVGDSQGNLQPNAPTPPQLFDAPRIRLGSVPGGVGSVQQAPRGVPAAPRVPFPDAVPGTLQDAVNAIAEAQPEAAPAAPIAPPLLRAGESIDPETGEVTPRVPSAAEQQQMDLQAALAASPTPDLLTPAGKRGKERRRDAKKEAQPAAATVSEPVSQPVDAAEAPGQESETNQDGRAEVRSSVGSGDQVNEPADGPLAAADTGASGREAADVRGVPDDLGADPAAAELVEPTPPPAPATQEADADGRGRAAEPVAQGGAESVAAVGPVGSGEAAARDADGEPAGEAPVGATAAAAAAPGTTEATAGTTEVDAAAAGFAANTSEGDTDVRTNPEQGPGPQQVERTAEAVEGAAQEEGEVAQPQQLSGEALTAERKRIGLPRVIRKADAVAALRRAGMKKAEAEAAFNTLERKGLKEGTRMGDDVAALIAQRSKPDNRSDQDKANAEWAENYTRVVSAPNLADIDTKSVERAMNYADRVMLRLQLDGRESGAVNTAGIEEVRAEFDRLRAEWESRPDRFGEPAAKKSATGGNEAKAKALRRIEKGTAFFATRERADEFIAASGIGDTHEAVQAKPGRFDVRPKAQAASVPAEQPAGEALPKRGEEDRKAMADRGIKPGMRVAYEGPDGRVEGTVQSVDRSGIEAEVDGVWVRGLKLEPIAKEASPDRREQIDAGFQANREAIERERFKKGDAVEFTAAGPFTNADGTVDQQRTRRGTIEKIDADQGTVKVIVPGARGAADYTVAARELRRAVEPDAPKVEAAAAEAATSPTNDLPEPTDAQKDAGNYKKGALSLHGLRISIENPAGTRRRPEWPPLAHHYGYIRGTEGKDGDHVDVFLGPDAENADLPVFVVDQVTQAGRFDEHKVMLGFADEAAARAGYLANYSKGWQGLGDITPMALADFKAWVADPARTTKRASADKQAAQQQAAPKSTESRFAKNKLVPESAIEAAKTRLRAKLGQLNSGLDPELLTDGMTIAAGYIEAGVRNFADFTAEMAGDFGDRIRPYLLSFWEGARNYPGLDSEGMTSPEEAREFHKANNVAPQPEEAAAVGTVEPKPKKRTPKRGRPEDATLTQDWGVEHIDAYTDQGEQVKKQFLREGAAYLRAVADVLQERGFTPHTDSKGRPEKPVSTNEGGVAGSGEVSLTLRNPAAGVNVHVQVAGSSLRGVVPGTASGVSVLARAGTSSDRYAARSDDSGNRWLPTDLSALDLAGMLETLAVQTAEQKARRDAAKPAGDSDAVRAVEGAGPAALEGAPAADVQAAAGEQPAAEGADAGRGADRRRPGGTAGRGAGLAPSVGNGAGALPIPAGGVEPAAGADGQSGLPGDAGNAAPAAEPGRSERLTVAAKAAGQPGLPAPQPPQIPAQDFAITDELELGEGGQKTKYRRNVDAIRLLNTLQAEGRNATPEEQRILALYVGWGGLAQAFDADNAQWSREFAELKELLSEDEYETARQSTQYAHYTSREIINGIYAGLQRMGFTGGNVLEAGGGVGNFIGLMPESMRSAGRFTLIERERIAAGIAKALYPKQNVQLADFRAFGKGDDGYFDAVIGNPPFGRLDMTDLSGRKHLSGLRIHNYFIAKSIDLLREGGLLVNVVSHGFMDAGDQRARQYIAERAELVAAIRLPNDAFKGNAHTEVTTDIVIFRKRPESEWRSRKAAEDAKAWLESTTVPDPDGGDPIPTNTYFVRNPDKMLGEWGRYGTMRTGNMPALRSRPGQDTGALLRRVAEQLPQGLFEPRSIARTETMVQQQAVKLVNPPVSEGGHFIQDGKLIQRTQNIAGEAVGRELTPDTPWTEKTTLGAKGYERLRQLAGLRQTVRELLAAELSDAPNIEDLRQRLNAEYDAYAKDGLLNDAGTSRLFGDDPDYPLLASLELDYKPGMGAAAAKTAGVKPFKSSAKKAAIFERRVIPVRKEVERASSPQDALNVSLAERGRLDADYIGKLLGRDSAEVLRELATGADPLLYLDPASGEYVLRDAYLSGNVRKKLAQARDAGMMNNAEALAAVLPEDVSAADISVRVGAPWVPPSVYEAFAKSLLGEGTSARLRYTAFDSSFSGEINAASSVLNTNTYGTQDYPASNLILAMLNNREIKVTRRDSDGKTWVDKEATEEAKDKAKEIRAKFQDWAFADADRAELLVRAYNDANNNYVTRAYDGSWLTFPGKVPDEIIKFRRHQRNFIARVIQDRTALADHVVGAGKTYSAIAAAMELKRTGLANKPMIVVPNHLVKQWAADFYRLYPGANILTATKKDFERANRRRFLAKIAQNDWDAVIIAHSSFGFVRPSPEFEESFIGAETAELRKLLTELKGSDDKSDKRKVKQIEASLERLDNRLKSLRDKPMDDLLDLEQLGVDQLFVDEAHLFKNLMFSTKMQNIRGLGDSAGSQRAYDMLIKTRQVMVKNGRDQGVVFLTGTPVSNSLAEMYHMMRYLMPTAMKEGGFDNFDAWANTFADIEETLKPTTAGGYKTITAFERFFNVVELLQMFDQVSDTVTMDDIKAAYREENAGREFPLPKLKGGRRQPVAMDMSDRQRSYMEEVGKRAEALEARKGPPKKGEDNHLSLMSDARKAAMDIRLVDVNVTEREAGARIDRAAANVFERWQRWDKQKGVQLVFSDLGTPLSGVKKELAEYQELKAAAAPLEDPDVQRRAELGDEQALAAIEEAEEAQAKLDAAGPDWLDSIRAAERGFSVYDDLRAALIERGIPAEQIAFIHDYNSDNAKSALFRKVNDGEIRVLLGSTPKMGAGTNVQKRLVALHHLDIPWKPSDVEQREGRIIRQGNLLADTLPDFEVEILAYVTKDTLDKNMWDIQERKIRGINQLRSRQISREIENSFDEMEMSASEMQAAATGNTDLLREIQLRNDITKLERKGRSYQAQQSEAVQAKRKAEAAVQALPDQIAREERWNALAAKYDRTTERPADWQIEIGGQVFTDPAAARAEALRLENERITDKDGKEKAKPLDVTVDGKRFTGRAAFSDAVLDKVGDREPVRWAVEGETLTRRARIANRLRQLIADAVAEKQDEVELGQLGDFAVRLDLGGSQWVLTVDNEQAGERQTGYYIDRNAEGQPTEQELLRVSRAIAEAAPNMVGGSRVETLRKNLASAKRTLKDLADRDMTAGWPDQAKLDALRAEQREIIKRIQAAKAEAAAARAASAENPQPAEPSGQFSLPEGTLARGVAPSQLQASIAGVIRGWNADTAPRVRVLADPEGLPARAKRDPRYVQAEGFYDPTNTTVYLIASNLPTERRALQVLAHEAVGHYGMEAITGPELWAELEASIARLEQAASGRVGEALASARRRYAGADRATFTKEAIAVMAERGVQNSIIARVVAAVRRFLRGLGFDLRLSESDVLAMVRDSARYLERGRQPAAEQPVTGAAFSRADLDGKRRVQVIQAKATAYGPTSTAEEVRAARAAAKADLNTQRKAGAEWTNAENGMRFRLSREGIGELLAWTADPAKLDLLAVLPQITEQGIVARVETTRVASANAAQPLQAQRWATLYAPVRVGGKLKIARMVAKDAGGGAFVYDLQHSAVLDPTEAASDLPGTEPGSTGSPAGRAVTVSELRALVNADPREAWLWSMPADRLPGLTVPERTTAAGVLRTMAEQGGLFRYPPSRATDLATVFEEVTEGTVSATYKGETLANFTEDLEDMAEVQKWELRTKDGRPMFVYVEIGGENRMYVDASPGRSGASMGSAVYAALFQYALNDGKVMMGDPNGLSPEALLRRTEHMLSAALKHGTTRMMAPHPRQVDPSQPQWDSGPQAWAHPLRWQPGNDEANLRALIETTYHNAAAFLRGTDGEGAVYSFPAKKFLTRDGRELTQADIARISKQAGKTWRAGLAEPLGNPNVSLIGPTTVARSIIAGTLLRAEDSQLAKPLLSDMNRRVQAGAAEPAQGLFYSLREPEAMGAAADPRGFLDRLGGLVKPDNVTLREAIGSKLQDLQPAALGALTLRHIAELGRKYLPQLPSYIDNLNRMQTDRNVLQEEGNELAEKWRGMQTKDRNSASDMADLMHDATIEGVDPAEEYRPLTFVNLSRETVPITDAALKDHIKRKRAQFRSRPGDDKRAEMEEIKVLRQKLAAEKRRRRSYPQLVARWNQLPAEWQALYREARDMYSKRSDQTMEALMARVGELDMPDEQKRKTGAQIRLMFEQARVSGPYFPLQRFGNYWLAAKNPDTGKRDFFMFESAADQLAGERDLKSQGYTDMASGKKLEQARDAFGAGEGFMSEVQRKLQKARVPEDLQDEIWQLYLRTLPDLSQRKHMIHRKKVAGYNPDALRAFAANANHGAYQVARLRYGHKMQRLVMQAKTWADSSAKTDQGNQAAVYYNELVKRHDWVMNPSDSALVNKISGLGFAWYLGVTPGAALVNLTQTAIVAGPVLASRFGAAKAMNALTKGMRDSIRTGGNIERTLRDEELQAYQAMRASGAVDKTQAHNLAGIAEVDSAQYSDSWHRVMKGISFLFHKAEVVNREATGMAAYRLGREQGMSFDAAVQYAENVIWESHFDYSNANRARFMQSGAAKVLLMFRQYSLSMSYFLWRNFYQTFKGETPKVKAEARRKLLGVLGMTAVFSGALGLPAMSMVFGVANAMADALGDDDDAPFDAEAEFRNFLADFMGADVARLIARGPVNFITGADVASRVTLDGLWLREPERELEGKALANYWLEQAAGPIGGIFVNAMQGLSLFQQGEAWRGVEAMTPKFVKDALRSIRYSTEGVNTLRGDALIPDLSPAQTVFQLAGLAPAQVNERYDANNAVKRYEEAILRRRQRLLDGFALSVRLEDERMRERTMQHIRAFNQANPEIPIDAKTIRTSLQARARYSERSLGGIAVNPKIEARAREQGRFAEDGQ